MAGLISAIVLLLVTAPGPPPPEGYCVTCHKKETERRLWVPTASVAKSVHAELPGGCVACHGGDTREPTIRAHSAKLGFKGKPTPQSVPNLCGGCHANAEYMRRYSATISIDQLAMYRNSGHGKALARGELHSASCITCHGFHDIKRAGDPSSPVYPTQVADTCGRCHGDPDHPASRKSAYNPVKAWKRSVHAYQMHENGDTTSPTCNDCHSDHGALPPELHDIHRVCGSCHAEQSARFVRSPHNEPFARLGFGECNECHGRHDVRRATDSMLSADEVGTCRACHAEGEKGTEVAVELRAILDEAKATAARARADLNHARRQGLLVPRAEIAEHELYTEIRRMRIAVHEMRTTALSTAAANIAAAARIIAEDTHAQRADIDFRRNGYIAFIGLIIVMMILIALKLRRLAS